MPAECYCIVLRNAARKVSAVYDGCLAPLGITIAQLGMLRKIGRAAPVSITELGRMAELDRSTTGRNVKVLERMNLVRVVAGTDQREVCIALTSQGMRMLKKAAPLWDDAQRKIEAALGQDEVARLCGVLQAL